MRDPVERDAQHAARDEQRDDADRDVDVEHPPPRQVIGEETADQRADHARQRERARQVAGVAAAFAWRDDVTDDRERQRHQPATTDALQEPEPDQLPHRLRRAAQRRRDEEQHDRALIHALAAVQVGDLPVQRHARRRRQQVRGHHPGQVIDPTELPDDRWQRGRHDRLIQRCQ